jgi:hypothetical protein
MIREFITVDPISSERMDNSGAIHRYNFGWIKTQRLIAIDPQEGEGVAVEKSLTAVSGYDSPLNEVVYQEVLPPSLQVPQEIKTRTHMENSIRVPTYSRIGVKTRLLTRVMPMGGTELVETGKVAFSVVENKEYADAIGESAPELKIIEEVAAGDSAMTISVANGIKTSTKIKG